MGSKTLKGMSDTAVALNGGQGILFITPTNLADFSDNLTKEDTQGSAELQHTCLCTMQHNFFFLYCKGCSYVFPTLDCLVLVWDD